MNKFRPFLSYIYEKLIINLDKAHFYTIVSNKSFILDEMDGRPDVCGSCVQICYGEAVQKIAIRQLMIFCT
ncbi:hypothetical protein M8369_35400, partial [Klebsiella pneumoniae]|nr:hypothetical protein [Klebsiella pneumoniae]